MDIITKIVDLTDESLEHSTYVQVLQLRRDVFISKMGWNLFQHMGCEFDQYDTPAAVHVVALQDRKVIGCMRLMRTDHNQSNVSYMILDAHLGRIPNLPRNIMEQEIRSTAVWEASRLAVSHTIEKKNMNRVLLALVSTGISYTRDRGATALLGLMNPMFVRVFQRHGINAYHFGPIADQRDGEVCVIRVDFEQDQLTKSA